MLFLAVDKIEINEWNRKGSKQKLWWFTDFNVWIFNEEVHSFLSIWWECKFFKLCLHIWTRDVPPSIIDWNSRKIKMKQPKILCLCAYLFVLFNPLIPCYPFLSLLMLLLKRGYPEVACFWRRAGWIPENWSGLYTKGRWRERLILIFTARVIRKIGGSIPIFYTTSIESRILYTRKVSGIPPFYESFKISYEISCLQVSSVWCYRVAIREVWTRAEEEEMRRDRDRTNIYTISESIAKHFSEEATLT